MRALNLLVNIKIVNLQYPYMYKQRKFTSLEKKELV